MTNSDSEAAAIKIFEMIVERLSCIESKLDKLLKKHNKGNPRVCIFCESWERKLTYDILKEHGYILSNVATMAEDDIFHIVRQEMADVTILDLTHKLVFSKMQEHWCNVINKLRSKFGRSLVIIVAVDPENMNNDKLIAAGANMLCDSYVLRSNKNDGIQSLGNKIARLLK